MGYVLEHIGEAVRLEKQAKQKGYILEEELKDFKLKSNSKILDAGCGNGLLTRFLRKNFPSTSVSGCDFSELRLHQAATMNRDAGVTGVEFFQCNLETVPQKDNSYDHIISRYVFEHLENPQKVMNELYRVCAQGGSVNIIDFDGMFFNLYNDDEVLQMWLSQLQAAFKFDLFIGRKLPTLMHKSGFKNVQWRMECVQFPHGEKSLELQNIIERLEYATPVFLSVFQCEDKVEEFKKHYLTAVEDQSSVLFYNKIIVTGEK